MGQVSIYLDEETIKKLEKAAKKENTSLSKWCKLRLLTSLEKEWPDSAEELFGSLDDSTLERPEQLSFEKDKKREKI